MKTCKYENCKEPINTGYDEEYCISHAAKDKKGISVEEFNSLILEKIDHEDFFFAGYIFPGDIVFRKVEFLTDASFCRAKFLGNAYFNEAQFSGDADFNGAHFSGDASFSEAKFSGDAFFFEAEFSGDANYKDVQFSGEASFHRAQFSDDARFSEAEFSGEAFFSEAEFSGVNFSFTKFSGEASFSGARFTGRADFHNAKFSGEVNFSGAKFSGDAHFHAIKFSGDAHFYGAKFSGEADFSVAKFSGDASFTDAKFSGKADFRFIGLSGELVFTDTQFDENCRFTLSIPRFDLQDDKQCLVIFERVQFNPYLTYFENIDPTKSLSKADDTSIGFLFRYCQLKDVYFSNCNLSNFSFYKSSFDEARFVSSHWGEKKEKVIFGIPYTRKNIIFEEVLFDELKHQNQNDDEDLKKTFKIEDIDNYSKIEILYQRMKAALDRAKGFSEAGWFYFNEFEMKRQALRKNLTKDNNLTKVKKWFKRTKDQVLILLKYDLYFIFAGYGEKPFWSFWWLIIFSFLFAPFHLLNGLQVGGATPINYTFSLNLEGWKSVLSWQFVGDFLTAFFYSLYRIIPVSYFPKTPTSMTPIGLVDLLLSLTSTLVMILMLSFIIIGLKRRFRRF